MKAEEINRRDVVVRVVPEQLQTRLLLLLLQYDKQGWCNILSAKIKEKKKTDSRVKKKQG